MRKLIVVLACTLSASFAASPKLTISSQSASDRETVVQVRNDSETPATAFLVGASDNVYVSTDMLLGARDGRFLKPGQAAEVTLHTIDPQVRVLAAIFEDGATEGESVWVSRLIQPRRAVYNEIPIALAMLQNENVNNFSAATVAGWFRQLRERAQAPEPSDVVVASAAEMYLQRAGSEIAARPARELTKAFEDLSRKLAASRPQL